MISSTSSSAKAVSLLGLILLSVAACAHGGRPPDTGLPGPPAGRIAVLPLENLTHGRVPLQEIRRSLIERLRLRGYSILDEDSLQFFMARHRMRHTGGIDEPLARAFRDETGTEAVLVTTLEYYQEGGPPKIALSARLVAAGRDPDVLWMEGVGLSGDDAPGILGLGLIEESLPLREKALGLLMASFDRYRSGAAPERPRVRSAFRPEISYDAGFVRPSVAYSIAVVPFQNLSGRRNADQILALHFVRQLNRVEGFRVVEPGVVRGRLLNMRIIMPESLSLTDADILFNSLNTDLILTGKVLEYEDFEGAGVPKATFSVMVLERNSRKIVWLSRSHNVGNDTVVLFDWGRVSTAHGLASRMTGAVVNSLTR